MLKVLDQQWREHLGAMDYLRQGIHLRGYAQKDYRFEYKREAFELFAAMLERIKFDTVTILAMLDVQVKTPEQLEREEEARRARLNKALQSQHAEAASLAQLGGAGEPERSRRRRPGVRSAAPRDATATPSGRARAPKVGRNQPCPCGSGKKFKNCHGVLEGVDMTKPRLRVVAAALFDSQRRVLLAERPAGKHMAGWWEFPGGKVAAGESDAAGAGARTARRARHRRAARRGVDDAHARVPRPRGRPRVVARTVISGAAAGSRRPAAQVGGCGRARRRKSCSRQTDHSSPHCSWYHRPQIPDTDEAHGPGTSSSPKSNSISRSSTAKRSSPIARRAHCVAWCPCSPTAAPMPRARCCIPARRSC